MMLLFPARLMLVTADYVDILTIPANSILLGATLVVNTAETANGTCDFGIAGGDTDCFLDAGALAATGVVDEYGAFNGAHYFAAATDLRVTATTDGADVDLDGVKFTAYAVYIELDAQVSKN